MTKPILSICIPTYNRASYLQATLDSIVAQPIFQRTSDIEIVISDNCSTDATQDVVAVYKKKFPDKLFYHRTEKNIGFDNFREVLSVAHGKFRKLNNDTLVHRRGSLDMMVNVVKDCERNGEIPFFQTGSSPWPRKVSCAVDVASF